MLLEGSYLGDVEKVLESFRLIRREMIRGGEINVSTSTLHFIHFIDMELACLLSIESVIPDLTLSLLFPFIIFFLRSTIAFFRTSWWLPLCPLTVSDP